MKDRKHAASSSSDDADAITNVTMLPSESNDTDAGMQKLDVDAPASNASYSLSRLEKDLKSLQSKWQTVEQEMTKRDQKISELQAEIDTTRDENLSLRGKKNELEKDIEERRDSSVAATVRLAEIEAQNVELRVHLQELQDYIDGRKIDWERLNTQLREYEDTIDGINGELEAHDDIVGEQETEKAALAAKVMELERELAELQGRYAERESSHSRLQATLSEQTRELGDLNGETIRLHKDIERLEARLARRDEKVQSLKLQLKEHSSSNASTKELLATHAEEMGELRGQLQAAEARIGNFAAVEHGLRDKLAVLKDELEEVGIKAAEKEIKAVELQAVLLESQSDQKALESELEAQRELVQVLESEVSSKQEELNVLDRSAERLSAIENSIREIDFEIDDEWSEEPAELGADAEGSIDPASDDVMLTPEELFPEPADIAEHVIISEDDNGDPIRYALTGPKMTIGRSRKADIRINNKYISREHARIRIDESGVVIEDAGSMNGFLVNSEPVMRHKLVHGDRLEIGRSKFRYLDTSMA